MVWRELNYVWVQRAHFPSSRRRLFGLAGAVLALLLAVPWHAQVHAVGVARAEHLLHLYAPFPARLQTLHPMGQVAAGTTLSVLDEPDLALRVRGHEAELRETRGELQIEGQRRSMLGLGLQHLSAALLRESGF
ncbi:hypothetical protein [Paraburkholderia hayleyella]|uniref:hypothetical protein n=1 Tax=Paraburkholderia hayleyella TaxID=2152889 RepID=UPI0012917CA1|nr:hypothetical protein [Paraburkholderia hayleyella]